MICSIHFCAECLSAIIWPGIFTVLGLVNFLFLKSVLVKFYFAIIYLFHLKITNSLASIIGKHYLTSLMSMELILMASFFNLNIVCFFTLDLILPEVQPLDFSENQLWALFSSLLTVCLLRRKCMLPFIPFLLAYLGLAFSYLCHFLSWILSLFISRLYSFLKYNHNYITQHLKYFVRM